MATRPSADFEWATTGLKTNPGVGKKAEGFLVGEKPPARWFNYLFNLIGLWLGYLEERVEEYAVTYTLVWGPQNLTWAASQNLELEKGKARLVSGTNTSGAILQPPIAVAPSPHTSLQLRHLNASTSSTIFVTTDDSTGANYLIVSDLDGIALEMEWRSYLTAVGANELNVFLGFHSAPDESANADAHATHALLTFRKLSADTNWQARAGNASAGATTDTGVAPVANTWQRFKIRYYGLDTPTGIAAGGALARWYIDDVLVAEHITTAVPAGAQDLGWVLRFNSTATGPAADSDLVVGPVRLRWVI
jgi:hypothetical protein